MSVDVDVAGKRVLVVGGAPAARRVLARYLASGASVQHLAGLGSDAPVGRPLPGVTVLEFPRSAGAWDALIGAVDLVAVVEASASVDAVIASACARHRTWLTRHRAASTAPSAASPWSAAGPAWRRCSPSAP